MACQIKNGKFYATNGKESILHKELEKQVGEVRAKDMFVLAYTKSFQDKVVNSLINSYKEKVKELLPIKENLSFRETNENKIKTLHLYDGNTKIGRIQTENYKDGLKIKSVLVNDNVKGKGYGTALYNKLITDSIESGISVYSDLYRTYEADRVWQSLKNKGLTDGKVVKALPKEFDLNGEISANEVLRYNENQEPLKEKLKPTEIADIKQSINKDVEDLYETIREAFYKGNVFSPTKQSLQNSGIYSQYEIENILSDINLQASIYSTIQSLKQEENPISIEEYGKEEFHKKTLELNSLGKFKTNNPLLEEQKYIEENAGAEFIEDEIIPLGEYTKIPVINEQGNPIETELLYENAVKIVDNPSIIEAVKTVINAHPSVETENLENEVVQKLKNYGIDATTLSREDYPTLLKYIEDPTEKNTKDLEDVLGFERKNQEKVVKIKDKNRSYVYLETNKSEQQLFDEFSLIQTSQENVYHKINKVENIVDFVKKRDKIDGYLSEIQAYKKYFEYENPQFKEQKISTEFTDDFDYLTTSFIADFSAEKMKNPNEFNNLFKITEKGIELISKDPITLETIKAHIEEGVDFGDEIQQYSLISKNMPNLIDNKQPVNKRVQALNNPKLIPQVSGKFTRVNQDVLVTVNDTRPFIKDGNSVFEMQEKAGNLNFYNRVEVKEDLNYNDFSPQEMKQIDTAEYKFLQIKDEVVPKIKKLYKKEELLDNFECA